MISACFVSSWLCDEANDLFGHVLNAPPDFLVVFGMPSALAFFDLVHAIARTLPDRNAALSAYLTSDLGQLCRRFLRSASGFAA